MYLDNKIVIIRSLHFQELSHGKVKLIIFYQGIVVYIMN